MKLLVKILKFILVIPIFSSASSIFDILKKPVGDYFGSLIGILLLLPFGIAIFLSFLNYLKDYWTGFLSYLLGIIFIVVGYSTLPDKLYDLTIDRKIKWENIELIVNPKDNVVEQQKRKRAFEQKRTAKLLEIRAAEIRLTGEPEWFRSKIKNYILLSTGVLLLLYTTLDYYDIITKKLTKQRM